MMDKIITLLSSNSFVKILLIAVALDTILGVLRAIKEHKFNSCVGIDGAIRKAGMLLSVCFLMATDVIMHINVLSMVPEEYVQLLGIDKMGICEFFSLLFVLYELVSILKNMTLCGLPVPAKIKRWIQKFLDDMTEELPEETVQELHQCKKGEESRQNRQLKKQLRVSLTDFQQKKSPTTKEHHLKLWRNLQRNTLRRLSRRKQS